MWLSSVYGPSGGGLIPFDPKPTPYNSLLDYPVSPKAPRQMKTFPEFMRFQVPRYYLSEAKSKGQVSLSKVKFWTTQKLLPNTQDPL